MVDSVPDRAMRKMQRYSVLCEGTSYRFFKVILFVLPVIFIHSAHSQSIIFRDDYNTNQNSWPLQFKDGECTVKDGVYSINKMTGDGDQFFFKPMKFEADKGFKLETSIKQVSGEGSFGLRWGSKRNSYSFALNHQLEFSIYQYEESGFILLVPWTKNANLKGVSQYNTLSVVYAENKFTFFINEAKVHESPPLSLSVMDLGIFVSEITHVEIDYLEFRQNQRGIRLVKDYSKSRTFSELGSAVNTSQSELGIAVSPDGSLLYFSRYVTSANSNIWLSRKRSDGKWSRAEEVKALNNEGPNFVIGVSTDGNALYLGNHYSSTGGFAGSGISVSYLTKEGWSVPEKFLIRNFTNYAPHAYYNIAADGKVLILCIQKEKLRRDLDLYVSFLENGRTWSEPLWMGDKLNSLGDEATAFLAGDGVTLYYSSNGKPGYGGYDIFVTKRLDDSWTNWSEPLNAGPGINSGSSEMYFAVPVKGSLAYMSVYTEKEKANIVSVQIPRDGRPDPVTLIAGRVFDSKTRKPVAAEVAYERLSTVDVLGTVQTRAVDGEYRISLLRGYQYGLVARAPGYFSISRHIDLRRLSEYKEERYDLYLVPVEVGEMIPLNNIFFDVGKHELKPESYSELKRLQAFLANNPTVVIEIAGHTDDQGSDKLNNILSENRAKSVLYYLLENGIERGRLSAKGYGKTNPVSSNEDERGRQSNRRVEFLILRK